jgi:hypothetical protein
VASTAEEAAEVLATELAEVLHRSVKVLAGPIHVRAGPVVVS